MMGQKNQSQRMVTLIFVIVFLNLFFMVPYADAQTGAGAAAPDEYLTENQLKVSPPMAIILVGLIATFFMLGCFSVYARRCFETASPPGLVSVDGNRRSRGGQHGGLDPAVIDTFPTFLYSDVKGLKIGKAVLECAVCLNEFEDQETLRLLPKCCHVFHPECIDTWLVSHVTCPVCRADLVPVPGEENEFDVLSRDSVTESTQPTRPPEDPHQVHEISELAIDLHIGSPEVIELSQMTNQNRPPRSTQKRPIVVDGKYPRSHSTGHSLIPPGENYERFTLRLPTEVQKKLNKPELRRAKSNVAFPSARSSKKGFRSASVRTNREKSNHVYHESFDRENHPDQWGLTMTPPFVSRSHSVQLSKEGDSSRNITASGSLLKSVKLPFERLFGGTEKNDVGERSFARLMGNSPV